MPYCPECGEEVEETHNFCRNCGRPLDEGTGPSERGTNQTVGPAGPDEDSIYAVGTPDRLDAGGWLLWVPIAIGVLALLISAYFAAFPDVILEQAEEVDAAADLNEGSVQLFGIIGVVLSLAVFALAYFYYREGYLDRRYFAAVLGIGLVGVFLAGNPFLIVLIPAGGYGLYKVW